MDLKRMSSKAIHQGIFRCEYRLKSSEYGLLKTEVRVRQALKEYKQELIRRGQNQFEFI